LSSPLLPFFWHLFCVGSLGFDVAVEFVKEKVIFLKKIKAVVVEFTLVWIWVAPEVLGIFLDGLMLIFDNCGFAVIVDGCDAVEEKVALFSCRHLFLAAVDVNGLDENALPYVLLQQGLLLQLGITREKRRRQISLFCLLLAFAVPVVG
jgi:hypothetical protein